MPNVNLGDEADFLRTSVRRSDHSGHQAAAQAQAPHPNDASNNLSVDQLVEQLAIEDQARTGKDGKVIVSK